MSNPFDQNQNDSNDTKVGIFDVIKNLPEGFSKAIGEPTWRAFGGVASLLTGHDFTPQGTFQQRLFGTNQPINLSTVGKETRGGIGGDQKLKIDPLIGLVAGLADAVPGGGPSVEAAQEALTPIQKLIGGIKTASKGRAELDTIYTAERAKRAFKGTMALEQGGEEGFKSALGALKGSLAKQAPDFQPIRPLFGQTDVDSLFTQIGQTPHFDFFDKISASDGLSKLFEGKLPPKSQLSLLEDVFGPDLTKAVLDKRTNWEKFKSMAADAINLPRSLITSMDMSAPLRQGIVPTVNHPLIASEAFGKMVKDFFSEKSFNQWLVDLPNNPKYGMMKDSGLYIANPNKLAGGLSAREESFMSNLAEKIPLVGRLVKASERSYISYLNKMRVDVFSNIATKFEQQGIADPANLKSLATFVNSATGRGSLGTHGERVAEFLNGAFFSPRLIAARFNMLNPVWYAKQTPAVRNLAIKEFAQFVGIGSTILALAKAGGADVENNPTSTDFGKIKVGDTRWDIWGGFQQWVRVFSQVSSGYRKTADGASVKLDKNQYPFTSRLDVAGQFVRGKLAPIPSLALELLDGQKLFGEKLSVKDETVSNIVPLYLQDISAAVKQFGPSALMTVGVPAFFGVGTQTYTQNNTPTVNPFSR